MKQKIFMLEDMNINVKLHISPKDYPKSLNPDEADFFIHIDSNDDDFSEDVINSLDDAAGLIKAKVDKKPEATQPYKFKIKKYGVYIRDEAKDEIELDFLYDVILSLVDEVQAYIEDNISAENDDNNDTENDDIGYHQQISENNENEINLEDDYVRNHNPKASVSKKVDNEEPVFKAEDNRRTQMKISKVSLSDTQTEEDGDSILKLLLSETKQDQK